MPLDRPPGDLQIRFTEDGACQRLALRGVLDLFTAPRLQEDLDALPACAEKLILDLAGVSFIDSSGLRVILRCRERCERRACALALTAARPNVLRLFELTGVLEYLTIEPNVARPLNPTDPAAGD